MLQIFLFTQIFRVQNFNNETTIDCGNPSKYFAKHWILIDGTGTGSWELVAGSSK